MPRPIPYIGDIIKGRTRSSNKPSPPKAPERQPTRTEAAHRKILLRWRKVGRDGNPVSKWPAWKSNFPLPKTTWYDTIKKIKNGYGPKVQPDSPVRYDTWDVLRAFNRAHCNASTAEVQIKTGNRYKLQRILNILTSAGKSPKKPSRTLFPSDPKHCKVRVQGAKALLELKKKVGRNTELIFLDESTFDRSVIEGSRAVNNHRRLARRPVANVLLFRGSRGFTKIFVQRQRLNQKLFKDYLTDFLNNYDGPSNHLIIVMDNCPAHKAKSIQAFEKEFKPSNEKHPNLTFQFHLLPPYTPQINPCEYVSNIAKGQIRNSPHHSTSMSNTSWEEHVESAIELTNRYTPQTFRHAYEYAEKLIKAGGDLRKANKL